MISAGVLCILSGIGLSAWAEGIQQAWNQFGKLTLKPNRMQHVPGGMMAIAMIVLIIVFPSVQASMKNAHQHTLPDRRNDLMTYMDTSVPAGPCCRRGG